MTVGYRNRVLQSRIGRRRALAVTATTAVTGSLLAACGGRGSGGSGPTEHGLVSEPEDTTRQAKRGGVYQSFANGDEPNINPLTTSRGAGSGGPEKPGYQKLLREKAVAGGTNSQVFEGDAAESYELTDGGVRLAAKLRPNNHFDPRPPTNGRVMNAQDVVYSWDKLVERSTYASVLAYKKDPAVPIESCTAVDDRTVVYKMAFPWAALLAGIAEGGPHQIVRTEAEDKFNAQSTIRGSGPWTLGYEPSVSYNWRRNPGYFDPQAPYLDGYDQPILTEYAAQFAQFRAKRVWDFQPNPADLPQAVHDLAGLKVYQGDLSAGFGHIWFSGHPTNPFRDVRMRRAASMAVDRQLYAEVMSEAEKLRGFGLPPTLIINNNIPAGAGEFWLDPTGKEMGEAAQYFKHDLAEAKKLVAAAGYANGIDLTWPGPDSTGPKGTEILIQMLSEAGFRIKQDVVNYTAFYLPKILSARGDWQGDITSQEGPMGFSPATGLQRVHHPAGGTTRVSCYGKPCDDEHARITALIEKALREIDPDSYRSQIHELQRLIGLYQGAVSYNYSTRPFSLT